MYHELKSGILNTVLMQSPIQTKQTLRLYFERIFVLVNISARRITSPAFLYDLGKKAQNRRHVQ